jgi:hypothetical protein
MKQLFALLALPLALAAHGAESAMPSSTYESASERYFAALDNLSEYDRLAESNADKSQLREAFTRYDKSTQEAVKLLAGPAEHGDAGAAYLLALGLPMAEHDKACTLLKASDAQGFLPAALLLPSLCKDKLERHDVSSHLLAALGRSDYFAAYYPMPTPSYRRCAPNNPTRLSTPLLDRAAFEAEAYFALASAIRGSDEQARQQQLDYYEAASARGCEPAETLLQSLHAEH